MSHREPPVCSWVGYNIKYMSQFSTRDMKSVDGGVSEAIENKKAS